MGKRAELSRPEGGDLVADVAERVGSRSRASAVFGKPVERGGITVIPVARSRWAFGAGGGTDGTGGGSGGGGAGMVSPIGYIEIRKTGAAYKPIRDWRMVGLAAGALAATGLATVAALRRRG